MAHVGTCSPGSQRDARLVLKRSKNSGVVVCLSEAPSDVDTVERGRNRHPSLSNSLQVSAVTEEAARSANPTLNHPDRREPLSEPVVLREHGKLWAETADRISGVFVFRKRVCCLVHYRDIHPLREIDIEATELRRCPTPGPKTP